MTEALGKPRRGAGSRNSRTRGGPVLPTGVSTSQARQIKGLYQAGRSLAAIGRAHGITAGRVSQVLYTMGHEPTDGRLNLLPGDVLDELYTNQGLSAGIIAERLGVSPQKVRDDLRRHGILLRSRAARHPGLAELGDDKLRRLYLDEGLTLSAIAERVGACHGAVAKALERLGVERRPRSESLTRPVPEDLRAQLVKLYVEEGLSMAAVAAAVGRSTYVVGYWLDRAGIPRRQAAARRRPVIDPDELRRAWVDDRIELAALARAFGTSQTFVQAELARLGIRRTRRAPDHLAAIPVQKVIDLYEANGLSAAQVAQRLGCSYTWVLDTLRREGVAIRPRSWKPGQPATGVSPDLIEKLYVGEGLEIEEVAARVGFAPGGVQSALRRLGIPLRSRRRIPVPVTATAEELAAMYVDRRLSDQEIAERLGTTAYQVCLRRRELGVHRPASPPPHPPPVVAPPPRMLDGLYVEQGLTLVEIARRYHTSAPVVRGWLETAGIPVARRTTRATRRLLPREPLGELYVGAEMTAPQVAAELDASPQLVRRSLHDHGIPVRPGNGGAAWALQLVDELYEDPEVHDLLVRHRVPQRRQPGTIAQRFPLPVPLTEDLLRDAYCGIGLSSHHIELLTGQPFDAVLTALGSFGIRVRTNQGMSPWRRKLVRQQRASVRRIAS